MANGPWQKMRFLSKITDFHPIILILVWSRGSWAQAISDRACKPAKGPMTGHHRFHAPWSASINTCNPTNVILEWPVIPPKEIQHEFCYQKRIDHRNVFFFNGCQNPNPNKFTSHFKWTVLGRRPKPGRIHRTQLLLTQESTACHGSEIFDDSGSEWESSSGKLT